MHDPLARQAWDMVASQYWMDMCAYQPSSMDEKVLLFSLHPTLTQNQLHKL